MGNDQHSNASAVQRRNETNARNASDAEVVSVNTLLRPTTLPMVCLLDVLRLIDSTDFCDL